MSIVHFLNVGQGDCSVIEHNSGRISVVDVCKARVPDSPRDQSEKVARILEGMLKGGMTGGNFRQKDSPENPIEYLLGRKISSIFRFILTHPDMDHMDGLKALFDTFDVSNFWDTANACEKDFGDGGPFDEEDWAWYEQLRNGGVAGTKRLTLYSGQGGKYWSEGDDGNSGDGLNVLAPTPALVAEANHCGDFNDCSYVLLYRAGGFRVLFCGDSHDKTWEHVLRHHATAIQGVDILVAPHHGRHSDRDFKFLDVVRPRLTLFGNAPSEHLAYQPWAQRGFDYVTNNQAGTIVLDIGSAGLRLLFTNEAFAKRVDRGAVFDSGLNAWHVLTYGAQYAAAA